MSKKKDFAKELLMDYHRSPEARAWVEAHEAGLNATEPAPAPPESPEKPSKRPHRRRRHGQPRRRRRKPRRPKEQ